MHQKNLATNFSIKKHLNLIKVGVAVTGIAMALSSNSSMANSSATNYPDRPISWVVPFPPGGAMDAIARVLSRTMSQELGQSIVVENKPGAGGNIGASFKSNGSGCQPCPVSQHELQPDQRFSAHLFARSCS